MGYAFLRLCLALMARSIQQHACCTVLIFENAGYVVHHSQDASIKQTRQSEWRTFCVLGQDAHMVQCVWHVGHLHECSLHVL